MFRFQRMNAEVLAGTRRHDVMIHMHKHYACCLCAETYTGLSAMVGKIAEEEEARALVREEAQKQPAAPGRCWP